MSDKNVLRDGLRGETSGGDDVERRVTELTQQVERLQRTVSVLTQALVRSGALGSSDERAILRAARDPGIAADEWEPRAPVPPAHVGGSPYRGGAPAADAICTRCGAPLDEDEPTLVSASRGRVCTLCFARGD